MDSFQHDPARLQEIATPELLTNLQQLVSFLEYHLFKLQDGSKVLFKKEIVHLVLLLDFMISFSHFVLFTNTFVALLTPLPLIIMDKYVFLFIYYSISKIKENLF